MAKFLTRPIGKAQLGQEQEQEQEQGSSTARLAVLLPPGWVYKRDMLSTLDELVEFGHIPLFVNKDE